MRSQINKERSGRHHYRVAILGITGVLVGVPLAPAATVSMVQSNSPSQDWTRAAAWSDNAAPHSDADYTVGSGFSVRTPLTTSSTFDGGSLTVTAGGSLGVQAGAANTATISQLSVSGGNIPIISGGTLAGTNLSLTGTVYIDTSTSNTRRPVTLQYTNFSGSGSVTLDGRGFLNLNNANTTYTGNWFVGGGNSNSTTQPGALVAQTNGSLGTGNITVNNNGRVDIGYDFTSNTSVLTLAAPTALAAGKIFLNHDLTFGAVNIGGTSLAPGTYAYSYLKTNYSDYFVDSGSGQIVVVPEPAGLGLCAAGLLGVLIRRRPRRIFGGGHVLV